MSLSFPDFYPRFYPGAAFLTNLEVVIYEGVSIGPLWDGYVIYGMIWI